MTHILVLAGTVLLLAQTAWPAEARTPKVAKKKGAETLMVRLGDNRAVNVCEIQSLSVQELEIVPVRYRLAVVFSSGERWFGYRTQKEAKKYFNLILTHASKACCAGSKARKGR